MGTFSAGLHMARTQQGRHSSANDLDMASGEGLKQGNGRCTLLSEAPSNPVVEILCNPSIIHGSGFELLSTTCVVNLKDIDPINDLNSEPCADLSLVWPYHQEY